MIKLTKLIHSTLLVEYKSQRILFDPGDYSIEQVKTLTDIDLLIITHIHSDHLHIESVKVLTENNPSMHIITKLILKYQRYCPIQILRILRFVITEIVQALRVFKSLHLTFLT